MSHGSVSVHVMVQAVESRESAGELARSILSTRERPLVVVSTLGYNGGDPAVDLRQVESELAGLADVVLIVTGDASRELEGLLPEGLQVYGGAARSYPVDIGVAPDQRRSPLRFPGPRATEALIGDALAHAHASGAVVRTLDRGTTASGTVQGLVAGRGVVALDGGGMASIVPELLWPWVPLEWIIAAGQRVAGRHDPDSGHFTVETPSVDTASIEAALPHRSVAPALVRSVTSDHAVLALHPDFEVRIGARDVSPNPFDRIDLLLSPGEVIPARVLHLTTGVHLQLLDIDDDEPVQAALPAIPGGAPWLVEGRPLRVSTPERDAPEPTTLPPRTRPDPHQPGPGTGSRSQSGEKARDAVDGDPDPGPGEHAPAAQHPFPGPGLVVVNPCESAEVDRIAPTDARPARGNGRALRDTQLALERARARIQALEVRLAELDADDSAHARMLDTVRRERHAARELRLDLADAGHRIAALESELSDVKRALRGRSRVPLLSNTPTRAERRERWSSDEAWARHEIYLAWVERIAPTDRERYALPDYAISERFAPSLLGLDDGQFDKALKATVDVLTGLVRTLPGRELHVLRTADSGNAPAHRRSSDHALCYRVYIEQNTPSARRLHFWHPDHAPIELERVVTHDTVDP